MATGLALYVWGVPPKAALFDPDTPKPAFPKGTAGNKRITDVVGLCKLQPRYHTWETLVFRRSDWFEVRVVGQLRPLACAVDPH